MAESGLGFSLKGLFCVVRDKCICDPLLQFVVTTSYEKDENVL